MSARAADLAALRWWLDAGVDSLVADRPRDWLRRALAPPPRLSPVEPPGVRAPAATGNAGLAALARAATSFDMLRAALATIAPDPVFLDGDPAADLMILGDAPSLDDANARAPFTAAPGRLLDAMLAALGRTRGTSCLGNVTYWANAVHGDVNMTMPVLARLLELARPRAILALGAGAAAALTGASGGVNRLRGRALETKLGGAPIPVIVSFAPSHLIQHPAHKALAWDDLLLLPPRIAI